MIMDGQGLGRCRHASSRCSRLLDVSGCLERHLLDDKGPVAEDAHMAEDARVTVYYSAMLHLQKVKVLQQSHSFRPLTSHIICQHGP